MQTVDVLIIVMAAVAIVGSAAGVALYEPPTGGQEYLVSFEEGDETELDDVDAGSQTGNGGDQMSADVVLDRQNVSTLTFRADISASAAGGVVGGPNTVTYTVVVLNATGDEVDRGEGTIGPTAAATTVEVDVPAGQLCPLPDDSTVEAGTLGEARAQAAAQFTCETPADWTVQIQVTGDQSGPLARTHSATVTPIVTTYSATVSADLPTPRTAQ